MRPAALAVLLSVAHAQDTPPGPHIEARADTAVVEAQLQACATELRHCAGELVAVPEPPSRLTWLLTGFALGVGLFVGVEVAQ